MNILVTGGAGYIGSHAVLKLKNEGFNPVIYDNMCNGNDWALMSEAVIGDIRDEDKLLETFGKYKIDAVMHFAALALVGESIQKPEIYFDNNVSGGINLLNSCIVYGIKQFVFSSTCAVYGMPKQVPIDEGHDKNPINPYGESKLMIERALEWYDKLDRIKSVCLRYFNVAGCDPEGNIGEWHLPEAHIIPNALLSAMGRDSQFNIFGDDYDTPDGTCIRDYVHVFDLVDAHILALRQLSETGESNVYNLGNSRGFSVKEILDVCERVADIKIKRSVQGRREGDPPILVSDSTKAREELKWSPKYDDIEAIVSTHWNWLIKARERGILKGL